MSNLYMWENFLLGDVTFESKTRAGDLRENYVQVYGVNRHLGLVSEAKYTSKNLERYKLITPGMFVYNPMRLNIGSIGYCSQNHISGLVSPDYVVFGCNQDKLCPDFLFYLIQTPIWKQWTATSGVGSVRVRIYYKELMRMPITLPPIEEQRSIAYILKTIDNKIELNRRMNETLESMARAIFKSWFVDFDPVRARVEGREPAGMDAETAALFPDSFEETEMGMVPRGWRVDSFNETIDLIGGGTPKTSVPEYWNGDIPWFSIADAPENSNVFVIDTEKKITKRGLEGSSTRLLSKGTTIITARGTVGKCALVGNPMTMNQSCYGVHAKDQRGDYFIYFALRNLVSELRRSTHGSVFDTITGETFKSVQTVIVPVELTRIFDKKISSFMERILSSLQESETLVLLRNALLPKLLSGEIRLKDSGMSNEANQWT